jgi:hypothetical protein
MAVSAEVLRAVDRLMKVHGLSHEAAAGLVGNWIAESGGRLNTGAFNPDDPGGSYGIGQWNRERLDALRGFRSGYSPSDELDRQIDFAVNELRGPESRTYGNLMAAKSADAAAQAGIGFERPDGFRWDDPAAGRNYVGRLANTQAILSSDGTAPSPTTATAQPSAFDLHPYLAAGKSLEGVNASLQDRLSHAIQNMPEDLRKGFAINSSYRSPEQQQRLWDAALVKYGSADAARKWVAPPGHSQHGEGNALDLGYGSDAQRDWIRQHAGEYGLKFPLGNEPWHIEPQETRGGQAFAAPWSAPPTAVAGAAPGAPQGPPQGVLQAQAPAGDFFSGLKEGLGAPPQPQQAAMAPAAAPAPAPQATAPGAAQMMIDLLTRNKPQGLLT